jgi:magnesium transporter
MAVTYSRWRAEAQTFEGGRLPSLDAFMDIWLEFNEIGSRDQLWLDLESATPEDFQLLETTFGLDGPSLKDIQAQSSLPKLHSFKNCDSILLHRLFYSFDQQQCEHRGVGIFRGPRFLITLHSEKLTRLFDHLQTLVKGHPEAFLARGNSRIFLHLLEGLVADYGPILNQWQENLEEIEVAILNGSQEPVTERILRFKKLVVTMRKSLIPQRQTLVQIYERLQLSDSEESIRPYLKDVAEEVSALLREIDGLGATAASVFDIYAAHLTIDMTKSSHQLNIIMQRLNVMTAIFLPLTFLVGVYGMNIEGIPELKIPGFYYFLWGAMALIVLTLLLVFKKLKWF